MKRKADNDDMTLKKGGAFSNSIIYIVMTVVQKGAAFLLLPIYTHLLLPEQYGIANVINAIGSFYILLFSFAIDDAVARYFFKYRDDIEKRKEFIGTISMFEILLSLVLFLVLLLLNNVFYRPFMSFDVEFVYIVLGIIVVCTTTIYSILQKVLIIQGKAAQYSLNTIAYFLINTGLTVLFIAALNLGAKGLLLANAITNVLFFIYSFLYLFLQSKMCLKTEYIVFVFQYSVHLVPNRLASWGLTNFNRVFIGKTLTSASVGIFNMGNNLASVISVFGNAFAFAYQPWIYSNLEDGARGRHKISVLVNLSMHFFIYMGLFISLFMSEVFHLFISGNYIEALTYIPLMIFGQVVSCFTVISIYVLFYESDMTKHISVSTMVGAATNIILCLVLIYPLGIMGTIVASSFSQCIMFLYITNKVNLFDGINVKIWKPLIMALVCFGVSMCCALNNVLFYSRIITALVALVGFVVINSKDIKESVLILMKKEV